jgi:hypothetical protein
MAAMEAAVLLDRCHHQHDSQSALAEIKGYVQYFGFGFEMTSNQTYACTIAFLHCVACARADLPCYMDNILEAR